MAQTMPRAVMTEGLPLPPRLGEMHVVCLVFENTVSTSFTVTPVRELATGAVYCATAQRRVLQ
jgi:hypothetical protein